LQNPQKIQLGNIVVILYPEYVAGRRGVVCGREIIINEKMSDRWLIQVESENIVLSLNPDEFQVISQSQKQFSNNTSTLHQNQP
jgi:hypothetical protein